MRFSRTALRKVSIPILLALQKLVKASKIGTETFHMVGPKIYAGYNSLYACNLGSFFNAFIYAGLQN